jgi:nitronate monooxygenase
VGTAFAYCDESGLRDDLKASIRAAVHAGTIPVRTDPLASPTGFPFKVVQLAGTVAEQSIYENRPRMCDLGYLRESYRTPDGRVGYRCAAEAVDVYVAKGGDPAATVGRKCICNALIASAGHPQARDGARIEPGIVTSGDDLAGIGRFMPPGGTGYAAAHVVQKLLSAAEPH